MMERVAGAVIGAIVMFFFMVALYNNGWMANAPYTTYTTAESQGVWHCWLEKDVR